MKRLLLITVLAAAALLPSRALALGLCTVGPLTGLDFGAYDVFSAAPKQVTGSLAVSCLGLVSTDRVTVSLSKGSSNTYASRSMTSGSYALSYNIYLGGYAVIFGDGTAGSSASGPFSPSALTNGSLTVDFYGQMPARQNVPSGTYSDTLIVTVSF